MILHAMLSLFCPFSWSNLFAAPSYEMFKKFLPRNHLKTRKNLTHAIKHIKLNDSEQLCVYIYLSKSKTNSTPIMFPEKGR